MGFVAGVVVVVVVDVGACVGVDSAMVLYLGVVVIVVVQEE